MKRVYFLRPVGALGPVKIGCSQLPELRLDSFTIWSPVRLELIVSVPGTHSDERSLHGMFAKHHLHGEWFGASKELLALIDHCRTHGELPALPKVVKFPKTRHLGFKGRGVRSGAKPAKAAKAPRTPRIYEGDRERGAKLREQYDAGATLMDIAEREGLGLPKVRRLIVIAGGAIRTRGRKNTGASNVSDPGRAEAMRERYVAGETLQQIGDDYGITRERVRQILRLIGQESFGLRDEHKQAAAPLTDDQREAARLYDAGTAPAELKQRFGLDYHQINSAVVRCGYELKPAGEFIKRDDDAYLTAEIARLYADGQSAKQIFKRLPEIRHATAVYRYLRKAGVDARSQRKRGALDAHVNTIAAAYLNGKSVASIAEMFGATTGGVYNLLNRHQIKRTPEQADAARKASEGVRIAAVRAANARRAA